MKNKTDGNRIDASIAASNVATAASNFASGGLVKATGANKKHASADWQSSVTRQAPGRSKLLRFYRVRTRRTLLTFPQPQFNHSETIRGDGSNLQIDHYGTITIAGLMRERLAERPAWYRASHSSARV